MTRQTGARRSSLPPGALKPVATPVPAVLRTDWLALHPQPALDVHAQAAILVDLDSREVMWARDEQTPLAPASLAKLVTVLVALDLATSLDQQVTVPQAATQMESDSTMMGLQAGEVLTVRDLLSGVFLVSGNDAAETLASAFVDRGRFIQLMNARAAALGMRDSHFTNPTGLDDPGLRTTVYDLAIATVALVTRYPDVLAIAGAREQYLPATPTHQAYELHSLVRLISLYPGATGLKTGYTDDAGYCLAGTATRGGRHLTAVLLHSDLSLTSDATTLLDYGFGQLPAEPLDPSTIPQL